jgi:DDB1- and CUL4-associated factor 5
MSKLPDEHIVQLSGHVDSVCVRSISDSSRAHSDELVDVFLESSPINCLSVQPQENQIFIAATDDGHVHLYDLRAQSSSSLERTHPSIVVAESYDGSYHSCTFHPQQTCLVATANARQGIELYDIRLSKK